jgi:glycosyltransferase involved in cell wall biosynthesis
VADNLLRLLSEHWRITIIAVSMPHPNYAVSWAKVIPALRFQNWMGSFVLRELVETDPPDITVAFMDPWVLEGFLRDVPDDLPLVGYLPVDGRNMKAAPALDRLAHAIFLSPFAVEEARAGGYHGPASVVGHGVDLELYHPLDKRECRAALGLPLDATIIGNVGHNQPRKRWDLTLEAFALLRERWEGDKCDTPLYLYCHCQPHDIGWDLPQLADWMGIQGSVLFPQRMAACFGGAEALRAPAAFANGSTVARAVPFGAGYDESYMPLVYNSLDLQWSTTWGEGFGLTTLEGMACGIPQVAPRHTALQEWAAAGACLLPATTRVVAPGGQNLVGGTLDPLELATTSLELLWQPRVLEGYRRMALALAAEEPFRWETCAAQMHAILKQEVRSGVAS